MGFFNKLNPFKGEKKSHSQNVIINASSSSFEEYLLCGGSKRVTPNKAASFYRECAAVATAVDNIADEMEMITPVLRDNKGKVITSHPLLDKLKNPNGADSGQEFMGMLSRYWLLSHDVPIFAAGRVSSAPVELWCVPPQNVQPTSSNSSDNRVFNYSVYSGIGAGSYKRREELLLGWRYYDGDMKELFTIRGFSSHSDNTRPDSPLQAAIYDARELIQGRIHNLSLLSNGARPSLLAVFKDTLDQEQHNARRESINEQFAGSSNAGKIGVISAQDLELKEFGTTNKDMDYINLDRIASEAVYNRYKIPLPLVSQDASTFNNMGQAIFQLYDRAVLPNYQRVMNGLEKMLFPRYGLDMSEFKLTYNPEDISALQMRRLEELKLRTEINKETINELRALLPNRGPVEGGDVIYQAATMVPVGTDMFDGDDGFTEEELRRQVERQDV